MAHQSARRGGARSNTLRRSAWILLALGLCLILGSLVAPGSRLEPAKDGLFLMGMPLVLVGAVLQGLDWMASYTNAAQGSWDHHVTKASSKPQRTGRKRRRRLGLFGSQPAAAELGAAGGRMPTTAPAEPYSGPNSEPNIGPSVAPVVVTARAATVTAVAPALPPAPVPARAPVPAPQAAPRAAPAVASDGFAPTQVPPLVAGPAETAYPVTPAPHPAQPAAAARATAAVQHLPQPLPRPLNPPARPGTVDPGPDTVIEEFVGYEGQDRMVALRNQALPPPRELVWPHPPRTAVVDPAPIGNEMFLDKLMDDVLAKIGPATARAVRAAEAAPGAANGLRSGTGFNANASVLASANARVNATAPIPHPLYPFPPEAAAAAPQAPGSANATASAPADLPPPPVWTRQVLENADHWRFAALVEKLYQQAGFATQLQAGHTMRGVVVLWLFSRHRPGMPASVVSCVHSPGHVLSPEEIVTVADLVKSRGLPRGQLATTAALDDSSLQLATARGVHLMDTSRLLELITRRSPEQQRALADRLA